MNLMRMTIMSARALRIFALLAGVALIGNWFIGMAARAEAPPSDPAKPSVATPAPNNPPAANPPAAKPAPSTPETKAPPSATPPGPPAPPATPGTKTPPPAPATPEAKPPTAVAPEKDVPDPDASEGKPGNTEIEPHGSPGVPQNATTESVEVPARPVAMIAGKSSYDEAFKSIRASLDSVKKAMDKAGLKPGGHPITIFSEPDDKGFKYQAAIPLAAKPDGKPDMDAALKGTEVTIGQSPSGKAIKFQHRGAYDDIDSTYDVITAYLDAKGLQVDNPYIEEYLTELTTADDPNLQVDIYVFVKP